MRSLGREVVALVRHETINETINGVFWTVKLQSNGNCRGWRPDPERDLRAGPCQTHRGAVRHIAVEIALPEARSRENKTPPGSGVLLCRDAIGRGDRGLMPESVPRPISRAQMSKGSV